MNRIPYPGGGGRAGPGHAQSLHALLPGLGSGSVEAEAGHWDLSGSRAAHALRVDRTWPMHKRVPPTVPNAGPSNMPSCMSHDAGRLASDLTNVSVLMVGDSTSAQIL